jgi:nucleoside-diphosphate-sugar epimerase
MKIAPGVRVLVTGGTGFVGRPCVAALVAAGHEVHVVARGSGTGLPPGVIAHRADLLAEGAAAAVVRAAAPTHLLHLAWDATPGAYWTSRANFAWARATIALLEAFADAGGRRVVAAGTCAELDWRALPPAGTPPTPYGACKDATRRLLAAFAATAGIEAAWGRLYHLYGPGEHPDRLVPAVARALLAGERAACTAGRQVRDYLHVADAAAALAALVPGPGAGTFEIGSGHGVPVAEVVGIVARACGRPALVDLGARPTPPDEPAAIVADPARLRAELGWAPRHGLEDGLAEAVAWWRAEAGR